MFKSAVLKSWADGAPFGKTEQGALEFYARTYADSETKSGGGRWAIATLRKNIPPGDTGIEPDGPAIFGDPAPSLTTDDMAGGLARGASFVNGFVNEATDPSGSGRKAYLRCFIIATAQALFACHPVEDFLNYHIEAHSLMEEGYQHGAPSGDCYLCSLAQACRMARHGSRSQIGSGEHCLWPGRSWGYAAPLCESLATKFPYDQQCASDEYLHSILDIVREAAALGIGAPSPFAIRVNLSRTSPCHLCASEVPDIARESSMAHIELPRATHRECSVQDLVDGRVRWPINMRENCGSKVAGDVTCDAALHYPCDDAYPCQVVSPAHRTALILFLDRADPDIGKITTEIIAPERVRFAGCDWEL